MSAIWKQYNRYILWAFYAVAIVLFLAWIAPIVGSQKASRLIQATVSGILVGGIYALTGLGIVVVTKSSGVFNFAHGFMMVIGGLLFWTFFTTSEVQISFGAAALLAFGATAMFLTTTADEPTGFWKEQSKNPFIRFLIWLNIPQLVRRDNLLKLVIATVVLAFLMTVGGASLRWLHAVVGTVNGAILLGLIIERTAIRPLVGQPLFAMVLMTLAVTEILQGFVQFAWGPLDRTMPIFDAFKAMGIKFPIRIESESLDGIIIVKTELLLAFMLAIVAVIGFILFFRYAQIGLAMRAVSENQRLAQSVGLRVRGILAAVWGIAALLAGIGGVLQGGVTSVSPLPISLVALRAFPAVLLGGLESIEGVLIGGIVVGLVEQWAILLFPGTQAGPELAPYIVLMVVLILRPEGLFGEKMIERI